MAKSYSLLDSGNGQKLECFGNYTFARPCSQALWKPSLRKEVWDAADAAFSREASQGWKMRRDLPEQWNMEYRGLLFKIAPTDFGHVGLFPEHAVVWDEMSALLRMQKKRLCILNLFAYSGGATLRAAQAGAQVCHLDASKGMVGWARENAALNRLDKAPIRWIVDDVMKFLRREVKRGVFYDGLILDPPTFGRGNQGEVFKVEREIQSLLQLCRAVLKENPNFLFFTSHTPGMTPQVLHHLLAQMMQGAQGKIEAKEMLLSSEGGLPIPSGSMAKWIGND
ncbi:MAG TPA: class I SAM-dependent methyltransferase [Rhabdochlamydiaceae bacterium]|jgi:23S rRNA (cytosine1962-C5)-methyltransferase